MIATGALLGAPLVQAQQDDRRVRIAILEDGNEGATEARWREFRNRLRELGWVAVKNLVLEARFSGGARERLPALVAELVALKPDVIVASTTPTARAAMRATSSIPIVFVSVAEPVAAGLVPNLARPGGNVTGQALMTVEISSKWLEILTEILPGARKFAFLGQASNQGIAAVFAAMQETARTHNYTVRLLEATVPQEIDRAFALMVDEKFDAFVVAFAPVILRNRQRIVDLAARHRLPGAYARDEYVAAGGLLSYSPDWNTMFRTTANQVHRVLQGTKPGELPIEQPTKFDLQINLKTAKALGIKIPQTVLVRADRVIE